MGYTVNGQAQDIAEPIQENGTTFVPLAGIVETLGGYVYWNNETKEAIIELDEKKYSMTAGDTNLLADGEVKLLNAGPMIKNSHLYVPIDFFETGLGCSVDVSADDVTVTRGT